MMGRTASPTGLFESWIQDSDFDSTDSAEAPLAGFFPEPLDDDLDDPMPALAPAAAPLPPHPLSAVHELALLASGAGAVQAMRQLQGPGLQGAAIELGPGRESMKLPFLSRPVAGCTAPHHALDWPRGMGAEYRRDAAGKKAMSRRKDKIRLLKADGGPADQRFEVRALSGAVSKNLTAG